jgi:hypothetical protein
MHNNYKLTISTSCRVIVICFVVTHYNYNNLIKCSKRETNPTILSRELTKTGIMMMVMKNRRINRKRERHKRGRRFRRSRWWGKNRPQRITVTIDRSI